MKPFRIIDMKRPLAVVAILLAPLPAFAQTTGAPTTGPRQEVTAGVGGYNYVEPGDFSISIHGAKFVGEYTGIFPLDARARWFVRTNLRAHFGSTSYDGWCGPWLIIPDSSSPNGYQLDVGDYSPCSDSGNGDWYVEGRALAGRDLVGQRWTWSPEGGLGVRRLSNGLDNIPGYRTDAYLYLPLSLTAHTRIGAETVLRLNVEYDQLIRGWQNTYQSKLGGGDVEATATAPAFTINGFTDISFAQHSGRAVRASASVEMRRRWAVEPYWIYWNVGDSDPNTLIATFTVNGIAAQQQIGFYEPHNTTNEVGVKVTFRFR